MYAFPQNIRYATSSQQGGRKYMEDVIHVKFKYDDDSDGRSENSHLEYAFIAVFDGHGGAEAAKFAKKHLHDEIVKIKGFWSNDDEQVLKAIREGFLTTHKLMWKAVGTWPRTVSGFPSTAGTTASVIFIKKERMYCAHVGDSSVVLGSQECTDPNHLGSHLVTIDHKPEDPVELKRIKNSGGAVVAKSGVQRVVWHRPSPVHKGAVRRSTPTQDIPFLAVARSLGDLWSYNWQQDAFVVSPDPDLAVYKLEPKRHRYIVIASDGLWNMVRPHEAIQFAHQVEKGNTDPTNYKNSAATLVNLALTRWNQRFMRADNTSVIVVTLEEEDSDNNIADDASSTCSASSAGTVPISEIESCDSTTKPASKPVGALVTHKSDGIISVSSLIGPSHPKFDNPRCHGQVHLPTTPFIKRTPATPILKGVRPTTPKSAPPKVLTSLQKRDEASRERPSTPSNIVRPQDGNDIEFTDSCDDEIRGLKVPSPFSPIHTPPALSLARKRHTPSPSVRRPNSEPPEKVSRQVASNITNSPRPASATTRSKARDSPKPSSAATPVDSPAPMDTSLPLDIDVTPSPSTPELVSPIWPSELSQAEGSSVIITPSPSKADVNAALKTIQHPHNTKKAIARALTKNGATSVLSAFSAATGAQNRIPGFQKRQLRRARYCVKKVKANLARPRGRTSVHRTRAQVRAHAKRS